MSSRVLNSYFQALRLGLVSLRRDWRAGELRLLGVALLLAVAGVSSVGLLSDRVSRALLQDSVQLLGGDLIVQADAQIPVEWVRHAQDMGLETSQVVQFPTMVSTDQGTQLAALKAVTSSYPLRGSLRVAQDASGVLQTVTHGPLPGEVWADSGLLAALAISLGQTVGVGDLELPVARSIAYEPDRGMQFISVAPRIMLHYDDAVRAGLMVEGSRIRYELVLAGSAAAILSYHQWLTPRLQRGQTVRTLADTQPNVQRTLDRARSFLALVTTLTVLLAAIAVALATRRYSARHGDGVAVMRCLGASRQQIRSMLWVEFMLLGLLAALAGVLVGYAVHLGLAHMAAILFDATLPLPSLWGAVHGGAVGVLLLLGFALPPLSGLAAVAPVRVLRQSQYQLPYSRWHAALGLGTYFLLLWWISGELRLSLVMGVSFIGAFLLFAVFAWMLIRLLSSARRWLHGNPGLRFALATMVRRKHLSITQLCAVSLGIMVLLLLGLTRSDLLQGWRNTLPPDAPNLFLINIQPDQSTAVLQQLQEAGVAAPQLAPMVRGRLVRIRGQEILPETYDDARVRRLVDREFNLSWRDTLPENNRIVQGRWIHPDAHEVSLEAGIAKDLGVTLGDTLTFDVAGQAVTVTVTSIRAVKWDALTVNFFALLTPSALENAPTSYITAFHLPPAQAAQVPALVRTFPNLTVFDVSVIMRQLEQVLERAASAVQGLFLLTVLAGVLVLGAALYATRDERMVETAILRALGASTQQVKRVLYVELLLMGLLAGLLAAATAVGIAWLLARIVFDFSMTISAWPWIVGVLGSMAAFLIGGYWALREVLHTPPLFVLRER